MGKSKYFNKFFIEDGEEMAQDQEMMSEAPPPPPAMLDPNPINGKTDKEFPIEQDGTTPEQDLLNFTNYQKLQYFKKFNNLLQLVKTTKLTFNNSKNYVSFDEMDDEEQHKIINLLISSLEEITEQINFFLKKGIASVNIDKTRIVFNAIVTKLNLIIDSFEDVMKKVEANEKTKNKNK